MSMKAEQALRMQIGYKSEVKNVEGRCRHVLTIREIWNKQATGFGT